MYKLSSLNAKLLIHSYLLICRMLFNYPLVPTSLPVKVSPQFTLQVFYLVFQTKWSINLTGSLSNDTNPQFSIGYELIKFIYSHLLLVSATLGKQDKLDRLSWNNLLSYSETGF